MFTILRNLIKIELANYSLIGIHTVDIIQLLIINNVSKHLVGQVLFSPIKE